MITQYVSIGKSGTLKFKKNVAFHPYLIFNGNCQDAMQFYQSCFGGKLTLKLLRDTPYAHCMPENFQKLVVEGVLNSDALTLFASDLGAENTFESGNRVSILFKASGCAEFLKVHSSLSKQSILASHIPIDVASGEMTNVTDKYGVNWILALE